MGICRYFRSRSWLNLKTLISLQFQYYICGGQIWIVQQDILSMLRDNPPSSEVCFSWIQPYNLPSLSWICIATLWHSHSYLPSSKGTEHNLCVTWTKTNLCEHAPFSRKGSKNKENSYHMVPLPNQDVFNIDLNDLQIGYWIKCHLNILSYGIPGNCLSQETARLQLWVLFFTEY